MTRPPSFGDIYTPVNMEMVSGDTEVTGYAIDYDDPQFVEIWIDGSFIAWRRVRTADAGGRGPVPVAAAVHDRDAGYRHVLDTTQFTTASTCSCLTQDYFGGRTMIGERRFVWTTDDRSPRFDANAPLCGRLSCA